MLPTRSGIHTARHGTYSETIQGGGHQPALSGQPWGQRGGEAERTERAVPAGARAIPPGLHQAHTQRGAGLVHARLAPAVRPGSPAGSQASMASARASPAQAGQRPQAPVPRGRHLPRPPSRSKRTPLG